MTTQDRLALKGTRQQGGWRGMVTGPPISQTEGAMGG
jgi:hypothetical protein